uniref:Outer membrane protein assembly factor BamE domain-containing protein n=1 Tax=Magnetococcus massalia (strain MO-1) TaxID=451514 RepID=A0A1S7LG55_MAGMO|nr:conserved protein of unknown function [Candidatus Magnetococcus massalia]
MKKSVFILLSLLWLGLASGCKTVNMDKGTILEIQKVDQITAEVSSVKDVHTLLGPPTFINMMDTPRWIYVMDRRKEGDQAVNRVIVTFHRNGRVKNVAKNFAEALHEPSKEMTISDKPMAWWKHVWKEARGEFIEHEEGTPEWVKRDLASEEASFSPRALMRKVMYLHNDPENTATIAPEDRVKSATAQSSRPGWLGWIWRPELDRKPAPPEDMADDSPARLPSWMKSQ